MTSAASALTPRTQRNRQMTARAENNFANWKRKFLCIIEPPFLDLPSGPENRRNWPLTWISCASLCWPSTRAQVPPLPELQAVLHVVAGDVRIAISPPSNLDSNPKRACAPDVLVA